MTNSATCNIIEDFKMYFATVSCAKRNKVSSQIIFSYLDITDKSLLINSQILYLIVYLLLNILTRHLWASDVPWDYNKSSNVFLLTEWSVSIQKPDSCRRLIWILCCIKRNYAQYSLDGEFSNELNPRRKSAQPVQIWHLVRKVPGNKLPGRKKPKEYFFFLLTSSRHRMLQTPLTCI